MPELLEVEAARACLEARALDAQDRGGRGAGRVVLNRGLTAPAIQDALVGRRHATARRTGKQLLVDTTGVGRSRVPGPVLGLHLGMSGRVVVDGESARPPRSRSPRPRPPWSTVLAAASAPASPACRPAGVEARCPDQQAATSPFRESTIEAPAAPSSPAALAGAGAPAAPSGASPGGFSGGLDSLPTRQRGGTLADQDDADPCLPSPVASATGPRRSPP